MLLSLDKQMPDLPEEVVFCKNCVTSNQRPRTRFNAEGVCSACEYAYEKDHVIDWDARERELQVLCDKHRSKDGSYDVVVPGSGGKDSAFVAHQLKARYGMHPLCVTWAPFEHTDIGWYNLQAFVRSGFPNIMAMPDGETHRKLCRLSFELIGDPFLPFIFGQKAYAYHVALQHGIKLMFYGENGEAEYGGSEKYKYAPKQGPEDWEAQYFKGTSVDDLLKEGKNAKYLRQTKYLQKLCGGISRHTLTRSRKLIWKCTGCPIISDGFLKKTFTTPLATLDFCRTIRAAQNPHIHGILDWMTKLMGFISILHI